MTTADSADTPPPSIRDHRERVSQPTEREGDICAAALAPSTSPVETNPAILGPSSDSSSQATGDRQFAHASPVVTGPHGRQDEPVAEDHTHRSFRTWDLVSVWDGLIISARASRIRFRHQPHSYVSTTNATTWFARCPKFTSGSIAGMSNDGLGTISGRGSGSRIIDAVGGGLMVGYRPQRSDQVQFQFRYRRHPGSGYAGSGRRARRQRAVASAETSARTKHDRGRAIVLFFGRMGSFCARQVFPAWSKINRRCRATHVWRSRIDGTHRIWQGRTPKENQA